MIELDRGGRGRDSVLDLGGGGGAAGLEINCLLL